MRASPSMPKKPPPPDRGRSMAQCRAILACDRAEFNTSTMMPTVHGIFDAVDADSFPCDVGGFSVYLNLVSGIGECVVDVQICDSDTGERIGGREGVQVEFTLPES